MDKELEDKIACAIWVGKSLFERGKTAGSTANMSFRHKDKIYITGSGTCFGRLKKNHFSVLNLDGDHLEGIRPSKEYPLHLALYHKSEDIQAVLHTHSFYSVLWSCLEHEQKRDCIPSYTPYLKMKLGTVGMIPYYKPGSRELFDAFQERIYDSDGYLLANHGPVVGDKDILSAFYVLEELGESARIAWELRREQANMIVDFTN